MGAESRLGVQEAADKKSGNDKRPLFDPVNPRWVQVDVNGIRVERPRDFGAPWLGLELLKKLDLTPLLEKVIRRSFFTAAKTVVRKRRRCTIVSSSELRRAWSASREDSRNPRNLRTSSRGRVRSAVCWGEIAKRQVCLTFGWRKTNARVARALPSRGPNVATGVSGRS